MDPDSINTRDEFEAAIQTLHKASRLSFNKAASLCELSSATIHDMVRGNRFPRWSTLKEALPVWNVDEADLESWSHAHDRVADDERRCLGQRLTEVDNPFDFDVHRAITVEKSASVDPLTQYVQRAHDVELAARIGQALRGHSAMAVLVAGSSTGKTRALWEALTPLRKAGRWRLWHPDESAGTEVLSQLEQVRSRTVVWLNETQRYLGDVNGSSVQIARQLRILLSDSSRAPVLVVGTLWPDHYTALSRDHTAPVAKLLEHTVIPVPDAFSGQDLAALRAAAEHDPRLQEAIDGTRDGRVTQYLAGGPELVRRYEHSGAPARAVMAVAMDAVRLEHRNRLPYALLRDAAPAYMSDTEWDGLEDNWFEQALAETSRSCKGASGPVTRIRPRPIHHLMQERGEQLPPRGLSAQSAPMFELADYLNQYGRTHLTEIPPTEFWIAAALHAHPDDQVALGYAAEGQGLFRAAAQLWKNAANHGNARASIALVRRLHEMHPNDDRPAMWAAAHASAHDAHDVITLLENLARTDVRDAVITFVNRVDPLQFAVDDPYSLARLAKLLRKSGADSVAATLIARIDLDHPDVPLGDPVYVSILLAELTVAEEPLAAALAAALATRAAAHIPFDNLLGVLYLLESMWDLNMRGPAMTLADRIDPHTTSFDVFRLARAVEVFRRIGASGRATTLLGRIDVQQVPVVEPGGSISALAVLHGMGEYDLAAALAACVVTRMPLDDLQEVPYLLSQLEAMKADDLVKKLVDRIYARYRHVTFDDDPIGVVDTLEALVAAGAHDLVEELAARIAPHQVLSPQSRNRMGVLLEPCVRSLFSILPPTWSRDSLAALIEQLPAAGMFPLFAFEEGARNQRSFPFGRQRDGEPAPPWDWDDLIWSS